MKTKRVMSMILTLALLLGVLPLASLAEETLINLIDIEGFEPPKAGQTIDDNIASLEMDVDVRCTLEGAFWCEAETGEILEGDARFEINKAYFLTLLVLPEEGCVVNPKAIVIINTDSDLAVSVLTDFNDSEYTLIITKNFLIEDPDVTYVTEVNLRGCTEPKAGKKVSDTPVPIAPENDGYYIEDVFWWSDDDYVALSDDDVFIKGKKYSLVVFLLPKEGCSFNYNTVAYLNDADDIIDRSVTGFFIGEGMFQIVTKPAYPTFDGEPELVTLVDVTVDGFPIVGFRAEDLPIPYSDTTNGYEVYSWVWRNDTDDRPMKNGETFEEGKHYTLCMELETVPGFVFAEKPKLTVNEDEELIAKDATIFSFRTVSVQPLRVIDSVNVGGLRAPEAGQTVGDSLAAIGLSPEEPYSISSLYGMRWVRRVGDDDIEALEDNDTFETGNTYYFIVYIAPDDGYGFSPYNMPVVLFNGEYDLVAADRTRLSYFDDSIICYSIDFELKNASVLYGDVFTDGFVNKKDSLGLRRYLADNNYEIDLEAADVNGDGYVNKKDSLLLKQYLAGWNVKLGA